MLDFFLLKHFFKKSAKIGNYVDYFFKQLSVFWVKELLVFCSIFFLEKYIIEYTSRYYFNFFKNISLTFLKLNTNLSFSFNFLFFYFSLLPLFYLFIV